MQNPVEPAGGRVIDSWAYFTLNAGNLRAVRRGAQTAPPPRRPSFFRPQSGFETSVHFTLNSHLGSEAASLETQTDIALHDFGVDEEHPEVQYACNAL